MLRSIFGVYRSFAPLERKVFLSAVTVFLLTFLSILTFWYLGATFIVPAHGGVFTEGIIGQPTAINPVLSDTSYIDRDLIALTFASLETLSESITVSEDGKEWTVSLKEGLHWSDGEVLTVDDLLFTIALTQNRELGSPLLTTWKDIQTQRVDDNTISIKLPSSYTYFRDTLESFRPLPQHIFSKIAPSNIRLSEYNAIPIGSGPYFVQDLERNKSGQIEMITLEANPYFAGGEVYIQHFNIKFFSQFKDAFALLNRGVISALGGARTEHIGESNSAIKAYAYQIPRYYSIFFNQSGHDGLKDQSVRQALRLATDKESIAEELFASYVETSHGPIPKYIKGYSEDIVEEDFSPSEAVNLLEEAGWEKIDNVWKKDEIELRFEMIVPDIDFLVATAQELSNQWKEIDIQAETIVLSPQDINEEIIKSRNYQILLFGNILRGSADIFSFWHSSQRFHPGLNLALYQNADVDEALIQSRTALSEEDRLEALSLIQEQIHNDVPAIFLYSPEYIYLVDKSIKGIQSGIIVSPANRFDDVENWHQKTKRSFSLKRS